MTGKKCYYLTYSRFDPKIGTIAEQEEIRAGSRGKALTRAKKLAKKIAAKDSSATGFLFIEQTVVVVKRDEDDIFNIHGHGDPY